MRYTFLMLSLIMLHLATAYSQVRGKVTSEQGEPLAFASVYVEGTTIGTTTNMNGEYALELKAGTHQVVFQYIGYKQKTETVTLGNRPIRLDVVLPVESIELLAIEIKANDEDPAYAIIRKAIAKRNYYYEQVKTFSCDVYIKGNVKILNAPTKILGQDVGDMDGSLDSNRQGIVYLSESVSKLYFKQPDKYKEFMVSSKVSGNNQGFSFNSAQDMNINLYRNFNEFGRNIISPIADGAMGFYRYRLEGVLVDEKGRLINKIKVIPKNPDEPAYLGHIYIVDQLWNIQSVDLALTGRAAQMPIFDTMNIRQTHVPVAEPDVWRMFSQTFSLVGGAFGFKFGGSFTGVYRNYELDLPLDNKFFGNEIMKVEKGANEKDTAYWNETRPIPLTEEEAIDYVRKDSIQTVRESKPYMDSIDRVENKFKLINLLFGYRIQNSWERRSFTIESPINTVQFNLVQGMNFNFGLGFNKAFDKGRNKRLEAKSYLNYGVSDKKLRAAGEFAFRFNPKNFSRIAVSGGRQVVQFNELEPISPLMNTYVTLFNRINHGRFFDKTFLKTDYRQELANGILLLATAQYARRSPLENTTDYSFFNKKKREFDSNLPINDHIDENGLARNNALTAGVSLRFRPGQQYMNYPDRKYALGSKYPDLWVHYRKGISINPGANTGFHSDVDFDRLSVAVAKRNITLGLAGVMSFRVEAGKFLNSKQLYFYDYRHFLGNRIVLGNPDRYLHSFKRMPYYEYSTGDAWLESHWEHNFKGAITDKIPGLKKMGWSLVAGANFLYTPESKDYTEVSLGFDGIGSGFARFLRFDVVSSFRRGKYDGTGYLIGMSLPIDDFEF